MMKVERRFDGRIGPWRLLDECGSAASPRTTQVRGNRE
jgi:hypothetical protein